MLHALYISNGFACVNIVIFVLFECNKQPEVYSALTAENRPNQKFNTRKQCKFNFCILIRFKIQRPDRFCWKFDYFNGFLLSQISSLVEKLFWTFWLGWKLSFSLLKFQSGRFFALLLQTDTWFFYANSTLFIGCIAYLSPFSKFLLNKWPQRKQLIACLYADQLPFVVHITLECYFLLL